MRSYMMENEYPDFLEHLKYIIATGNIASGKFINAVVDLSHWDRNTDFKLAKEDGIVGIIHKATQGVEYIDPEYQKGEKPLRKKKFSGENTILVLGKKAAKIKLSIF